jgi:signal peptidase I
MSKKTTKKKGGDSALETFKTFGVAILIALFIRTFFFQAFRIPSGSMEDSLLIGDFLLVDKLAYGAKVPGTDWRLPGWREPRRGDIIVFKDPQTDRDFIKRCIATEGEGIHLEDNVVFIDGKPLEEPYKSIKPMSGHDVGNFPFADAERSRQLRYPPHRLRPGGIRNGDYVVAEDSIFMMGDNRNNSMDSRYWGELPVNRVVGRAFVLYWSTDPDRAPGWVKRMDETWVKGFFSLFLGRPRFGRVGTWLAHDWSDTYATGWAAAEAAGTGAVGAGGTGSATGTLANTP